MRKLKITVLLVLIGTASIAFGATKWSQPPDPTTSGLHSHDYQGSAGDEYQWVKIADDFECSGGDIITIRWYGNYEHDVTGQEQRGAGIASFHLSLHNCDQQATPWHLPLDPELTPPSVDAPFNQCNETDTGLVNNMGEKIYSYEFTLPTPYPQTAGTWYWLDVMAQSVDPVAPNYAIWRWQEARRDVAPPLGHAPAAEKSTFTLWSSIIWPPVGEIPERYSDMAFEIISEDQEEDLDFGDAPEVDASGGATLFPTKLANDGARHGPSDIILLGQVIDYEPDGQPTLPADGDDNNPTTSDDEDGVTFPSGGLIAGSPAPVAVVVSGSSGFLNVWVDFNGDMDWDDTGENVFTDLPVNLGTNNLTITAPASSANAGYARFRLTSFQNNVQGYKGLAADGEVEDYLVAIEDGGPVDPDKDFGDAPEGANAMAYPSLGTIGQFPTCINVGPAGWIQHTNFGGWFGQSVDFEIDGNAGLCPAAAGGGGCFPPYDQDECFQDGDAGLMFPDSFTIDSALNVVTCSAGGGAPLGQVCAVATWGVDGDIWISNNMPGHEPYVPAYVNVLMDWDQSGNWGGSSSCPPGSGSNNVPEYVLVDLFVPPNYVGPLSGLTTPGVNDTFVIGPNSGYVWTRFTLTEVALQNPNWDGSGSFEDGETEDYLLKVDPSPAPDIEIKFQQLPLNGLTIDQFTYWGHDELSTAYRNPDSGWFEGCYMADDFADLKDTPVIKLKWWGSYLENEIDNEHPVTRFLIAFESDTPAVGHPDDADYIPSHPNEVLLSQIVHLTDTVLTPGQYSETQISPGGPPCYEALFEYEALLENPFPQEPNTVYWLKIVALTETDPAVWNQIQGILSANQLTLCDFLNKPFAAQQGLGLEEPLTRWGWHNRDYTQWDSYAATPPLSVYPGEHNPKSYLPNLTSIGSWPDDQVWHFQDDAVSGVVKIDEGAPEMPFVDQDPDPTTWKEEFYKYFLPYCDMTQGVDGPDEIVQYSKDLAFELWTKKRCKGDLNDDGVLDAIDAAVLIAYITPYAPTYTVNPIPAGDEKYDLNGDTIVDAIDVANLIAHLTPYAPTYTTTNCMP